MALRHRKVRIRFVASVLSKALVDAAIKALSRQPFSAM
jgi:hypothetical protein